MLTVSPSIMMTFLVFDDIKSINFVWCSQLKSLVCKASCNSNSSTHPPNNIISKTIRQDTWSWICLVNLFTRNPKICIELNVKPGYKLHWKKFTYTFLCQIIYYCFNFYNLGLRFNLISQNQLVRWRILSLIMITLIISSGYLRS